jgi:hypothetical protein
MTLFRWLDKWARRRCSTLLWRANAKDRCKRGLPLPGGPGADIWEALELTPTKKRTSRKTDPD